MSRTQDQVREAIAAFCAQQDPKPALHDISSRPNSWRDTAMRATAEQVLLGSNVVQAVDIGVANFRSVSHASEVPTWLTGLLRQLAEFVHRWEDQ